MPFGALAAGAVSGISSLLGGFGQASAQRARFKALVKAQAEGNEIRDFRAREMNAQIRARADAAALVPEVTTTDYGRTEYTTGDIDVDAFLAQSARMGINPITMVRSGSLGHYARSYTQTGGRDVVTTTGAHAMDAALAGQHIAEFDQSLLAGAPQPQSTMQIAGGALSDAYSAYSTVASQDAQNAFQLQYLRQQQVRQSVARPTMGAIAGGYTGGGVVRKGATLAAGPVNVKDMYRQVRDNNPDSSTFNELFWVVDQDVIPDPEVMTVPPLLRVTKDVRETFAPAKDGSGPRYIPKFPTWATRWPVASKPGNYGKSYDPLKSVFQ